MAEQDKAVGPTYVKNITGHPVKGIGAWSDAEIAYLIRTGIRRDGQMTPALDAEAAAPRRRGPEGHRRVPAVG
jgi:hypothetical protein